MDRSSILPKGNEFAFGEQKNNYLQELHVNQIHPLASNENIGTMEFPLKTIQEAADRATPGTRVLIHQGTYREHVIPKVGGSGPEQMISYEAYQTDEVFVKASEVVTCFTESKGWRRVAGFGLQQEEKAAIWELKLAPYLFNGYQPFCAVNILHDRLFIEYDKTDMTTYLNRRGMIFCDGKPLQQVSLYHQLSQKVGTYWVEANGQTVHFRLAGDEDPQKHSIEITCREQCFAPTTPFLSYIKIKGLILINIIKKLILLRVK